MVPTTPHVLTCLTINWVTLISCSSSFLPASHVVCDGLCGWTFPWSVFLFPGGVSCSGCKTLHNAGQRRVSSVDIGKATEEIW